MNKTIIALFSLILVLGSVFVLYSYLSQPTETEQQYDGNGSVSDDEILTELDDVFVSEDDDIELGDIV